MSEIEPVTTTDAGPRPPEGGEPTPKSRAGTFFFGAFTGCLLGLVIFGFLAIAIASSRTNSSGDLFSTQKVAIVPIDGEIFEARDTLEALHRYADSATVRAIVMRINSPGGAVAASQEIYEEIRKIRHKSGKPIVASLDNTAASGAFYIAAACDQIVANPGTITGSIGVILQWMEIKDLVNWAKMKPETITSGTMKAAGSPLRDLTDAERAYLQRITAQLHAQFIRAIVEGRKGKMTAQEVTQVADGRVFTGEEALGLKLVDRLGNLDDAVTLAARLAGVRGRPGTIYPRKRKATLLDMLSDATDSESPIDRALSRRAAFLYRW